MTRRISSFTRNKVKRAIQAVEEATGKPVKGVVFADFTVLVAEPDMNGEKNPNCARSSMRRQWLASKPFS